MSRLLIALALLGIVIIVIFHTNIAERLHLIGQSSSSSSSGSCDPGFCNQIGVESGYFCYGGVWGKDPRYCSLNGGCDDCPGSCVEHDPSTVFANWPTCTSEGEHTAIPCGCPEPGCDPDFCDDYEESWICNQHGDSGWERDGGMYCPEGCVSYFLDQDSFKFRKQTSHYYYYKVGYSVFNGYEYNLKLSTLWRRRMRHLL